MLRALTAALLIAWLQGVAVAEPPGPPPPAVANPDPHAAVPASESPWIDLSPARVLNENPEAADGPDHPHPVAAAATLGGIYVGFATWTYFAWYRHHKPLSEFSWGGDGWLGARTYAGGADKFGHAWATMMIARSGTELLNQFGGYGRTTSALVGTALSELLFLGVEVKDGFYYEFSFSDATGDTLGAAAALALSLSPRLDELFDYRVEYWPSAAYRRQFDGGNVNVAEDYTGETYLLAFHPGAVHSWERAVDSHLPVPLLRFVDVAVGYGTRGYKPDPPNRTMVPDYEHHQEISFGITLNAQGLCDWIFDRRSRPAKKITHGFFEVFNAPFTYVPAHTFMREPTGTVMTGGA